ncbi:MAG TPA: MFS transporter [Steroidobacteraceae bacterium]|nr:MFS transporter [Steroidobacteraceae bacterium]
MTRASSKRYTGYAVLLLCLVNIANYGQRMVVSILLPAIKADLALTDAQLGFLIGGGFAILYAVAGVPLARFADRHGRVRWLSVAIFIWSLATGLFGLARSFIELLAARVMLGAAQSVGIPASHSLLGDYVTPEKRPFALGMHSAGGVLGATLAMVAGGWLGTYLGWREAIAAFACAGAVLAAVTWTTLPEPLRVHGSEARGSVSLRQVVHRLAALRSYVLVLTSVCFAMLVEYGLSQWLPSYYVRQFGLSVEEVGFRYGLAIAVGGIPGSVLGGMLVAALARRDVRWLVWFPAAMYVVAIPTGLCMLLAPNAGVAFVLNAAYALAVYSTNGALWGACFVHVPSELRATTSALTLLVAGIAGLAVGPVLVGSLSDALAVRFGHQSLQMSLVAVECLATLVVIPLLCAGRFVAREGEHNRVDALRTASSAS